MLDLQAGVHFQEVEVAILVDDELDRTGAAVADGLGQGDRLLAHAAPGLLIEKGARRLLDHLLVPALDRALALAEVKRPALLVGQHLYLDMTRFLDELLDEDPVVAEAGARLVLGAAKAFGGFLIAAGDAHALAAAACRGLEHDGIADIAGDLDRLLRRFDDAHEAGHRADAGLGGDLLGLDLVAHGRDCLGRRADEGQPRRLQRLDEVRLLRQEAETGMDRLGAGVLGRLDDPLRAQVALRRR